MSGLVSGSCLKREDVALLIVKSCSRHLYGFPGELFRDSHFSWIYSLFSLDSSLCSKRSVAVSLIVKATQVNIISLQTSLRIPQRVFPRFAFSWIYLMFSLVRGPEFRSAEVLSRNMAQAEAPSIAWRTLTNWWCGKKRSEFPHHQPFGGYDTSSDSYSLGFFKSFDFNRKPGRQKNI